MQVIVCLIQHQYILLHDVLVVSWSVHGEVYSCSPWGFSWLEYTGGRSSSWFPSCLLCWLRNFYFELEYELVAKRTRICTLVLVDSRPDFRWYMLWISNFDKISSFGLLYNTHISVRLPLPWYNHNFKSTFHNSVK